MAWVTPSILASSSVAFATTSSVRTKLLLLIDDHRHDRGEHLAVGRIHGLPGVHGAAAKDGARVGEGLEAFVAVVVAHAAVADAAEGEGGKRGMDGYGI